MIRLALSDSFKLRTISLQWRLRNILLTSRNWEERLASILCSIYIPSRSIASDTYVTLKLRSGTGHCFKSAGRACGLELPRFGTRGSGRNDNILVRSNLLEHAVAIRWMENITVYGARQSTLALLYICVLDGMADMKKKTKGNGGRKVISHLEKCIEERAPEIYKMSCKYISDCEMYLNEYICDVKDTIVICWYF